MAEKAILRRWIEGGARYEKHWAFVPPVRPAVPGGAVENPLDAFIIERLTPAGLELSAEAERNFLFQACHQECSFLAMRKRVSSPSCI